MANARIENRSAPAAARRRDPMREMLGVQPKPAGSPTTGPEPKPAVTAAGPRQLPAVQGGGPRPVPAVGPPATGTRPGPQPLPAVNAVPGNGGTLLPGMPRLEAEARRQAEALRQRVRGIPVPPPIGFQPRPVPAPMPGISSPPTIYPVGLPDPDPVPPPVVSYPPSTSYQYGVPNGVPMTVGTPMIGGPRPLPAVGPGPRPLPAVNQAQAIAQLLAQSRMRRPGM